MSKQRDGEEIVKFAPGVMERVFEHGVPWRYSREAQNLYEVISPDASFSETVQYLTENPPSAGAIIFLLMSAREKIMGEAGRKAALARYSQPGDAYDKQAAIRQAWASGKYSSRDICAEQECAALGMSFSAARRALRNTPEPVRTVLRST